MKPCSLRRCLERIHHAYPRGGETLVLRAPNLCEACAWTEAIVKATAKARKGMSVIRVVRKDGSVLHIVGVGMGRVAGAGTPCGSADDWQRKYFGIYGGGSRYYLVSEPVN